MVAKKKAEDVFPDADEKPEIEVEYQKPEKPEEVPASSNLALWNKLKDVTDATALKGFTRSGGFKGTDINPTWRMERMTEIFGPVGWGWGYEVVKRWTEVLKGTKKGGATYETSVVFATVRCWYVPIGEQPYWPKNEDGISNRREPPINALWTGEQDGGTEAAFSPDEVYKQAITDGFGKTSAQVGLAASIYRGKWDDSKYREDQERFSLIQSVEKYFEVLVPELQSMSDTRQIKALYGRASFNENKRIAKETDFKLHNEFEQIVGEHERRIVSELWAKVREVLKGEDLEVLSAEIEKLAPQISALPEEREVVELRGLVKERKAVLKKALEPKEETPKEQAKEPAKAPEKPAEQPREQDDDGSPLELIDVPLDANSGKPRYGAFTKLMIDRIAKIAGLEYRPSKEEFFMFYDAHASILKDMEELGGNLNNYVKRMNSDYQALIEMLEDK